MTSSGRFLNKPAMSFSTSMDADCEVKAALFVLTSTVDIENITMSGLTLNSRLVKRACQVELLKVKVILLFRFDGRGQWQATTKGSLC